MHIKIQAPKPLRNPKKNLDNCKKIPEKSQII